MAVDLNNLPDEILQKIADGGLESLDDNELSLVAGEKQEMTDLEAYEKLIKTSPQPYDPVKQEEFTRGALSGANRIIPGSSQIMGASATAKQLISGEIGLGDVPEKFTENTKIARTETENAVKKAPVAAGLGMGMAAGSEALATGGLSAMAQSTSALAQALTSQYSDSLAQGKSHMQAAKDAADTGAITAMLIGAPGVGTLTKKSLSKARTAFLRKFQKMDTTEKAGEQLLKVLGANEKQSRALIKDSPDLLDTVAKEELFDSLATKKIKVQKTAEERLDEISDALGNIYANNNNVVSKSNVANKLEQNILELSRTDKAGNTRLIKALRNEADQLKKDPTQFVSMQDAWANRQRADREAFKNAFELDKSRATDLTANVKRKVRDAYVSEMEANMSPEVAETTKFLNKRFSDVKRVADILASNRFKQKATLIDRVTVGAAIAAVRTPAVAVGLYGGRAAGQALAPRFGARIVKSSNRPGTDFARRAGTFAIPGLNQPKE